ncbi:MAG: hypothetical protein R3F17_08390 [Planctomycetota bacterium]
MIDQEQQISHRIQQALARPESLTTLGAPAVHVGNLGRSLIRTGSMSAMLRRVLDNYDRVDLMLLFVGPSDLVGWAQDGCPALATPATEEPNEIFHSHPAGPFSWLPHRSAVRRIAAVCYHRCMHRAKPLRNVGSTLQRFRAMRQRGEFIETLPDPAGALQSYRGNLRALIHLCQDKARRVVLVVPPWMDKELSPEEDRMAWNCGLGHPGRGEVKQYLQWRHVCELLHRFRQITEEVARLCKVDVIEPTGRCLRIRTLLRRVPPHRTGLQPSGRRDRPGAARRSGRCEPQGPIPLSGPAGGPRRVPASLGPRCGRRRSGG